MESLATYLDLFMILKSTGKYSDSLVLYNSVVSRLNLNLSDEDSLTLKEYCRRFTQTLVTKWKQAYRKLEVFLKKYEDWLQCDIDWPSCVAETKASDIVSSESHITLECTVPSTSSSSEAQTSKKRLSRKPFQDLGIKQKKRRTDSQTECESSELAYAAVRMMRQEGLDHMASVIEFMMKHPEAAEKLNSITKKSCPKRIFTPEKALGIFLSLKLSKWQYITLRETAIREGVIDLYPSYYKLQQAKSQCYPDKKTITVTDAAAKISLQALLDLTVKRILKSLHVKVEKKDLILVSKWGFDGASSQSRYKQKMEDENNDSSVFMTSLVPLELTDGNEIIWQNPKPCSAYFCRPVQFSFLKENKLAVTEHLKEMEDQIKLLTITECNANKISHELMMTMIDGKVCTYITEARSSATCYLCLAKPSDMNILHEVIKRPVSEHLLKFGLSSLHARIKCMECLLHIAYRQDLKKWAVKGEEKLVLESRKKQIQDGFKEELNLLIDVVKQGSGTTNDGNTARKFFENPKKTANITGLDEDLIYRFAVLLQAITSEEYINTQKFKEYSMNTAKRYVEFYSWYYMPSTVHKLLVHGSEIIASNAIVPIGNLSEEASEARNKDFRRFREHHSRKMCRKKSNEDILNMLLLSSDPYISATRPVMDKKKKKTLFAETLTLLESQEETEIEFCDVSQLDSDSELDSEFSDSDC